MPKNTTGGKRAKSMARKNVNGSNKSGGGRLRLPKEEYERVAVVTKMYGNGMFAACLDSGEELMGHIRGKHTGRSKRDNFVRAGAVVLVGLRDWESEAKNCDLLEVYNEAEIDQLAGVIDMSFATGKTNNASVDEIQFVGDDAVDEFWGEDKPEDKQVSKLGNNVASLGINDVEVSFDDI